MGQPDPAFSAHTQSTYGVPEDARLMGLDRNTEEGAMVAMAGSLRPVRPAHRVVAWLLLLSFAAPLLLSLLGLLSR